MSSEKYIGLDVDQATISVAVMDSQGKVVMESILETKASTILEFFAGLRGSLFVTFEEGTWAAWLYDLLSDARADMRSYKMVDDHTLALTNKKSGKTTISGRIVVSADGKSRTVTVSGTGAAGKKIHSTAVYDKQ